VERERSRIFLELHAERSLFGLKKPIYGIGQSRRPLFCVIWHHSATTESAKPYTTQGKEGKRGIQDPRSVPL
jgi:hypothetical protein